MTTEQKITDISSVFNDLKLKIDEYQSKISQLESEVSLLKADNNQLRTAAISAINELNKGHIRKHLEEAVDSTAEQALAKHNSKFVRKIVNLYTHTLDGKFDDVKINIIKKGKGFIHPEGLLDYANMLDGK